MVKAVNQLIFLENKETKYGRVIEFFTKRKLFKTLWFTPKLGRDTACRSRGDHIAAVDRDDKGGKEYNADWGMEFLGELDPFGYQAPKKRKKEQKSKMLEDTDGMEYGVKAKTMEELAYRLSQFSGPSDHRKEINSNKEIIEAEIAKEVLERYLNCSAQDISNISRALSITGAKLLYLSEMDRIA
ncbi:hypothetical protein L6164_003826 [Bauhinia variegata]|uniref:Uncharacterized protein n=1 Tax=Bauhinia variegata TaxID=167791 RepID=A0ACB9Q4Q1_BAUVA|nr:hypothetical protein L6164_003826 [Bauhinia variegata]